MAFSYEQYVGDGNTTAYPFSFEGQDQAYIREDDIVAVVDGTDVPFTLLSTNTLELETAPSNGAEILIRRVMPKIVPYADFSSGNNFGEEILNNSFLQLLYIVHEILDGWFPEGFTVREAVDYLEGLRVFSPDPNDPNSVINFGAGDARYVEVEGDTMQGSLNMDSYPVFVRTAVNGNEPARKDELDQEKTDRFSSDQDVTQAYQEADANLQAQLTGNVPLEASAFSPISWHDQVVENSVVVPENKNAWSFGPLISVAEGQSVTIGEGSFWTVADGLEVTSSVENFDEGEL